MENLEAVKQAIADDTDVNVEVWREATPLLFATYHPETANLLCKHGGKTGEALKAEWK